MRTRKFWTITVIVWVLYGLVTGIQVWISMITHGHSIPLLLSYFVLVWGAWAAVTVPIVYLAHRWPVIPPHRFHWLIHTFAAFLLGLVHIAWWLSLMLLMRPYDRMGTDLDHINIVGSVSSRITLELFLYILVIAAVQAIDYYDKYRARTLEMAQLEASLNEARLHALELQLQPHFLFNTLNAVASLVRIGKSDEAVTMIAGLSDLLRYTLDRSGVQRVTVDEETSTLRRYLEIQRMRFADRLRYEILVEDDAGSAMLPTLILQPLAENAVRHGISRSAGEGRIDVRAFRQNGLLRVEMFNTGTLSDGEGPGIGLQNTRERLRQMYGDKHHFDLRAAEGGVLASLSIPWSQGT